MDALGRYARLVALLVLAGVTTLIWYSVFYFENHRDLRVTFFDVGQGDAIFIETPGGRNQILIDGGPGNAILPKIGRALPFWDRSLDLLVLTHPHADHLDGLLEVLKRYRVGAVVESGVPHSIPEYQEWRELLSKKKIPAVRAQAGQRVSADQGVALDILSPFEDFSSTTPKHVHDATVVSRLRYGDHSLLLMGDAERSLEYRLLAESFHSNFSVLDSDILKVGHHGSKTSSSGEFLQAVSPATVVISAGRRNRYGHPHPEVVERLQGSGARIFRTDRDGDVHFQSDGLRYLITTPQAALGQ